MSAKLGAFTEEVLSSLKLIIFFGKEKEKLAEYEKLCELTCKASSKAGITFSIMGGLFFCLMVGFTAFAWFIGFFFVKYDVNNPVADRVTTVPDIVTC